MPEVQIGRSGAMWRMPRHDRFALSYRVAPNGCWLWTQWTTPNGYGRFWDGGKVLAHRWSYEQRYGPVPEGMQLDHFFCGTRLCVNPDHVRPVTPRENTLRGNSIQALNAAKTHCIWGHEYTAENTWWYRGYRNCKACRRKRAREWRAANPSWMKANQDRQNAARRECRRQRRAA